MMPTDLKAVLFDLDGTLIDTAAEFVVVVQQLRAEHGMGEMDPERIRASVSNGARALVNLGLGIDFEAPEFESKRLRLLELYMDVLGAAATPYPGIPELLEAFAERGISWGVATNKPRAYAEPLLKKLGLYVGAASAALVPASATPPESAAKAAPTTCGSLVCPDDVKDRKPHPESLYLNCRELGCSPHQAIYVGDHLRDIEAGKRAGMHTIAAAYGYIEPGDSADDWGADVVAARSEDLFQLILND